MNAEETKALLRRWYDEMWGKQNPELILELVGPTYTRHEMGGTRVVTPQEYYEQSAGFMSQVKIENFRYVLVAEADKVCALGSWELNGAHWDWVQLFRGENGKLVETWLSGIGMESQWGPEVYANVR